MTYNEEQRRVQQAMNAALSGLREDPWMAQRVLAASKGELPVKKKLSVSVILMIALLALSMSAALAAGLGLFGELSGLDPADDGRLQPLDTVSETLSLRYTVGDGITVEISQAYYEGNRVFVSYRLSANCYAASLHEGAPEGTYDWAWEQENFVWGESMCSEHPVDREIIAFLDGRGQRWAEESCAFLHDGLFLADGTYLDIIGGNDVIQPDGSMIGWKECEIPADRIRDTLDFKARLARVHFVLYQDGRSFHQAIDRDETVDIPFTLRRNDRLTALSGSLDTAAYAVQADFVMGQVDLKGVIRLSCPAAWAEAWAGNGDGDPDLIEDWVLYRGQTRIDGSGVEEIGVEDERTLRFTAVYPRQPETNGLRLVPVYSLSGEHPQEAVPLAQPGIQ